MRFETPPDVIENLIINETGGLRLRIKTPAGASRQFGREGDNKATKIARWRRHLAPKRDDHARPRALPPPILPFAFLAISSAENGSKKRVGGVENVKLVLNRVPKAASGLPEVILAPDCLSHLHRKAKAVHQRNLPSLVCRCEARAPHGL